MLLLLSTPFGTNSILTYASDYYLKNVLTVLHSAVARKINLDPNTFILLAPGTPTKVSVNNVMLGLGYVLAHSLEHISSKNPVTADVSGFREAYWGRLGYSNGNILSDYLFLNILNNIILKEDKRPINAVIGVHERVPGVITAYQQIKSLFTLNSEGVNVSWFPGPTSNWYGTPTNLDALKKYPKLGNLDTIAKGLLLPRKEVDLLVGSALCNTTSNWVDSFYFNATSIVYEATSQFISKRALLKGAGVAVGALAEPASKGVPVN